MLDAKEQARIASAIRDAESRTAGEIVVVVAGQASAYRSIPVIWGLLGALAAPWPLIWLTELSVHRIFVIQLAVALALCLALSWSPRRHVLVPDLVKRRRAHAAARHEFVSRGLTRTRDRGGVLIYVAAAEHYAEVLADTGIAERVDDGVWRDAVAALVDAIRAGRVADGLVAAVEHVGRVLAEHAPPRADDTDELPNRVFVV